MSVRLRAVSYLNTRPLTISLENNPAFELSYSVPSVCAADLEAGRVDLGLIPSIEYARSREPYYIVPDVAIVSRGEVFTVRLFWRGDLRRVKRIALDTSSRTSAALLHILLREKFHLAPEFAEAGPALGTMLEIADAALLIGDPVFQFIDTDLESMGPREGLGRIFGAAICIRFLGRSKRGCESRAGPGIEGSQTRRGGAGSGDRLPVQPGLRRICRVLRALSHRQHLL